MTTATQIKTGETFKEEAQSGVLPVVPVASDVRVSYFRDQNDPDRVLTVVRRRALGFVEVGWAVCRPASWVPYEGKLYRRVVVPVTLDPTELAMMRAIDKKFSNKDGELEFQAEPAPPKDIPPPVVSEEEARVQYVPQFSPVYVSEGFIYQKGDSFKRSEGRAIATQRLNDTTARVLVMPRKDESILYTALRGLRDNDQSYNDKPLVPPVVKEIAADVLVFLEEERDEERLAAQQGRKPFWKRMTDGFKSLFGSGT